VRQGFNCDFAIIGGGLQGASLALELARRGRRVSLIERDPRIMNRASLRNEGKIHLGLIYAADATGRTGRRQLAGAFSFFPLLNRWLGDLAARIGLSTPFCYLVARDSLKSPAELAVHYSALSQDARLLASSAAPLSYPGYDGQDLARPATAEKQKWFVDEKVAAVFDTAEIAVNVDQLADAFRQAVASNPQITVLCQRNCRAIKRRSAGARLEGIGPDGLWFIDAERVVNCAWENRIALDAQMGLAATPGWVYRLKYRLIAKTPKAMAAAPSATIVLGPYGDIVIRDDGCAYLSWYPAGCRDWSSELAPPESWNAPCEGSPEPEIARNIAASFPERLAQWCPAIKNAKPLYVDAGAIVAYGRSDVDDPNSELHDRTRVGVFGDGEYFSIDPGKLTAAPLYAIIAADQITGDRCEYQELKGFMT